MLMADRGVAQLVGKHREELVLAAVGLLTLGLDAASAWVISRPIFEAPTIRPEASRIGETVRETSMIAPSLRRRLVS